MRSLPIPPTRSSRTASTPRPFSTATSRTRCLTPIWKPGASWWFLHPDPHIVRRVIGQALGIGWGQHTGHQAPISAAVRE